MDLIDWRFIQPRVEGVGKVFGVLWVLLLCITHLGLRNFYCLPIEASRLTQNVSPHVELVPFHGVVSCAIVPYLGDLYYYLVCAFI